MQENTDKADEYMKIITNPSGYKRFDIVFPCANHGRKFKDQKKLINSAADMLRPVMMNAGIGFVSQAQHAGNKLDITISYINQAEDPQVLLDQTSEIFTQVLGKLPLLETAPVPDQFPFWIFRKDNSAVLACGLFGQGRMQVVEVDLGSLELKSIKPYEAGMKTTAMVVGKYGELRRY